MSLIGIRQATLSINPDVLQAKRIRRTVSHTGAGNAGCR